MGGAACTLGTGDNLISILPILKNIRDTFLKALKEIKEKCWLCKQYFDRDDLREYDDDLFCDDCWEEFKEKYLDEDD